MMLAAREVGNATDVSGTGDLIHRHRCSATTISDIDSSSTEG